MYINILFSTGEEEAFLQVKLKEDNCLAHSYFWQIAYSVVCTWLYFIIDVLVAFLHLLQKLKMSESIRKNA